MPQFFYHVNPVKFNIDCFLEYFAYIVSKELQLFLVPCNLFVNGRSITFWNFRDPAKANVCVTCDVSYIYAHKVHFDLFYGWSCKKKLVKLGFVLYTTRFIKLLKWLRHQKATETSLSWLMISLSWRSRLRALLTMS